MNEKNFFVAIENICDGDRGFNINYYIIFMQLGCGRTTESSLQGQEIIGPLLS